MRTRDWRRYKEKTKVVNRLKKFIRKSSYYRFIDANGNLVKDHDWVNHIGTYENFIYKTLVTNKYATKDSVKYGKKGNKKWYSKDRIRSKLKDEIFFKKMLEEEYGIKHFNINYGFIQNNTGKTELDYTEE